MHSWHSVENGSIQLVGDGVRTVYNSVENPKRCDKFSKRPPEKSQIREDLSQEEFEKWRNRPVKESVKYLLLDARYEKVRVDGSIVDCALLIAYGIQDAGRRRVLGVSVELSEAEVHWRKFLESLSERGLHGLKMITSDNHAGLKAARQSVFPSVPWQRCQFHLQQNASSHIPKKSMEREAHEDIRNIFNMPSREEAESMLKKTIEKYENKASGFAEWLEHEIPEGLTVFNLVPDSIGVRRKLRTTNMIEFQNKELKKRTRCIKLFPNRESLLRIATALLIKLDETWLSESKRYMLHLRRSRDFREVTENMLCSRKIRKICYIKQKDYLWKTKKRNKGLMASVLSSGWRL